jgi:hypothetical protein
VLGWRQQFVDDGVSGIGRVRPGRGRKPTIPGLTRFAGQPDYAA